MSSISGNIPPVHSSPPSGHLSTRSEGDGELGFEVVNLPKEKIQLLDVAKKANTANENIKKIQHLQNIYKNSLGIIWIDITLSFFTATIGTLGACFVAAYRAARHGSAEARKVFTDDLVKGFMPMYQYLAAEVEEVQRESRGIRLEAKAMKGIKEVDGRFYVPEEYRGLSKKEEAAIEKADGRFYGPEEYRGLSKKEEEAIEDFIEYRQKAKPKKLRRRPDSTLISAVEKLLSKPRDLYTRKDWKVLEDYQWYCATHKNSSLNQLMPKVEEALISVGRAELFRRNL